MTDADFLEVEQAVRERGPEGGLDFLADRFLAARQYPQLFEARLMKKRLELGLPLVQLGSLDSIPEAAQPAYEQAMVAAAREVGSLYLADGDIPRAWSYLRVVGDSAPVAAAIENLSAADATDEVIGVAYQERVHPRRGFELILEKYGVCRAITAFDGYPTAQGRAEALLRLLQRLYGELAGGVRWAIEQRTGAPPPASENLLELIAGRDWLFGQFDYYADPSHVSSVLRYSVECDDPEVWRLALEMAEYSQHLHEQFHYKSEPPFENTYTDYAIFLRALLGREQEAAIAHFHAKIAAADPDRSGSRPAEVLVDLLARLGRFQQAIQVSEEHLSQAPSGYLACPSTRELCQMAGDFEHLMLTARAQGDLLSFAAGLLQQQNGVPEKRA